MGVGRRMTEFGVRVAQGLQRSGQRFEKRLELGKVARSGVGDRARQPCGYGWRHQKESVPRTLIGIMCTLWTIGVVNRLIEYLNAMSTPSGPDVTPPPPSMK